jgi:hypothetical protein
MPNYTEEDFREMDKMRDAALSAIRNVDPEKETLDNEDLFELENNKKEERIEKIKEVGIKTLKVIGTIAVILFIGYSLLNNSKKNEATENVPSEAEIRKTTLKNELVEKYNTVVFDDQNFAFSKDIQDNSDKNFLLQGSINDIYEKDGKSFVKISDGYYYYGIFEINSEQINFINANTIKDDSFSLSDDFFVVVKINDASKPIYEIDGEADAGSVYINTSLPDVFILKGNLADIKKID